MIIGITGGIGSGKSTIARELARRGYRVYDCDAEAKRIIAENHDVQAQIVALLGEEAFVDGKYNTAYVARRVFAEPKLLTALNAIVHPVVIAEVQRLTTNNQGPTTFIESAILYESGLDRLCDRVVYVDAPEDIRIARTVARDHCDAEQVRARISRQQSAISLQHKKAIVLMNDGSQSIKALVDSLTYNL